MPRDEHSALLNEGYRLDFSIPEASFSTSKSYTATKGHTVSSSSNTYTYTPWCFSGNFYLMYLFDQTLDNEVGQYYVASSSTTTITLQLDGSAFVTKLKVYPTKIFPSKFKVYLSLVFKVFPTLFILLIFLLG